MIFSSSSLTPRSSTTTPLTMPLEAPFVDVRPDYGSTSTILTEYLRAASIKPSQTLPRPFLWHQDGYAQLRAATPSSTISKPFAIFSPGEP